MVKYIAVQEAQILRDHFWGANSSKIHTSWICLFVVSKGSHEECAAINYVYSCPGSPAIKGQFLESRSCQNHISWICLFVVLRGRQKKYKSVKL